MDMRYIIEVKSYLGMQIHQTRAEIMTLDEAKERAQKELAECNGAMATVIDEHASIVYTCRK